MPRVVPSQIVAFIDEKFSFARTRQQYNVDTQFKGTVDALQRLVDELPDELLLLDGTGYNQFRLSVSTIKSTLEFEAWNTRGHLAQFYDRKLGDAISDLRACLEPLPDEAPSPSTAELAFIQEADLRDNIRIDISAANRALHDGLWKAATVLAAAAAGALLLWAITEKKSLTELESARAAVIPSERKDARGWDLDGYIKVAKALALIKDETEKQANLAREFRNLIHPGRSIRTAKVCDRGTALSALAAVELIVRDLS
jgi:hypothetical protein